MSSPADHDIAHIRAENPGPFTLEGTNSWVVGRDPSWVIDPGPDLEAHLDAIAAEVNDRGGIGGIALTHDHADHLAGLPGLLDRLGGGVPVAANRGDVDTVIGDGDSFGPLLAIAAPGHAPDHLAFVAGTVAFTGDAVLGHGSVFISPDPGALIGYLAALGRMREMRLDLLCPGHGPPIGDPTAKLDEYISHRLDRERKLLEALVGGARTQEDLLDAAWDDAPAILRPAAAVTLQAHMDKLREEGRLPADVA